MEPKITLVAYAKINLTMEILGKRDDGYHNIRSVMQFISLHDTIEIEPSESFTFQCNDDKLLGEDNLAVKAYRLLQKEFHLPPVNISLHKTVPYMSGMGGGSADCASVLCGLNTIFQLGLSQYQLATLGKTLGADVPACIYGHTLLAEGIGEQVTPILGAQKMHFCIIKPMVSFPTKEMYHKMDTDELFETINNTDKLISALQNGDAYLAANCFFNSFEQVASPKEPITAAKQILLKNGALGASMTGAGSAVFGLFANEQDAKSAYEKISETGVAVYYCHSL